MSYTLSSLPPLSETRLYTPVSLRLQNMQTRTKSGAVENRISALRMPRVWTLTSAQWERIVTVDDHINRETHVERSRP